MGLTFAAELFWGIQKRMFCKRCDTAFLPYKNSLVLDCLHSSKLLFLLVAPMQRLRRTYEASSSIPFVKRHDALILVIAGVEAQLQPMPKLEAKLRLLSWYIRSHS